jgi:hypothetical protein
MSINEILADVKNEGDTDPFKELDSEKEADPESDKEKETPSESHTEKEPKVEEPVQGDNTDDKDVPFNKRWEKHAENLKAELENKHQEEMVSLRQELEARIPKNENIPDWFTELYGDNEVAWQKYAEHSRKERDEIKSELLAEQEANHQRAIEDERYWNNWVEEGIKGLQDEGKKFERNELIKVMLDYRPTDNMGGFDFQAGYKILEAIKEKEIDPAHSQARKRLADTTTKSSHSEKVTKDYMTSNELRGKSWNQI